MYFLHLNDPGGSAYNVAFTARINSSVNVIALRKSLQKLINRHSALRTNFFVKDGTPVQEIHGYKEANLEEKETTGLDENSLREMIRKDIRKPFDLEKDDLFRAYLYKVSDNNFVILLSIHHIVNDGFSMSILLNELKHFYESETGNRNDPLPALQHKYTDYIKEIDEFIKSDPGNTQSEYWVKELGGELPVLNLPVDRDRPPSQTFNGDVEYFNIEPELVEKLKTLAKEEGTTLFVTLLSAYELFLHRYTGQDEIIVGTPTAGRFNTKFENVIGYFINPVAIRCNLTDDPLFKDFLLQVKSKVLNAITFQHLPFSVLVDRLHLKRDPSRSAVFQTFFGLQRLTGSGELQELIVPGNKNAVAKWGDLELSPFEISQQEGQFEITLEFAEGKNIFSGAFKYNTDLFERETIRKMAGHFKNLLNSIVSDRHKRISEMELLSEEEKQTLTSSWNNTEYEFRDINTLHRLFENQVERSPDNTALIFEGTQLSFDELNKRSNQLANYLIRNGAGPGTLIGLCVERSVEMVIGLLGILKSGSAYIPIDTEYPGNRIDLMIKDSKAKIILTQKSISDKLFGTSAEIILIKDKLIDIQNENYNNPDTETGLEDPAYVIYTSGSTGVPKGVVISHRSIANHMLWMREVFDPGENDSVLQKTPFSFDASVWEFYLPLITGGKLVIAKPEGHMDMPYMVDTIINNKITYLQMVPSLLRMIMDEKGFENCRSLKNIFCGGEVLTYDLQEKLFTKLNVNFYNLYGPTEATIDATYFKCEGKYKSRTLPVGKPVYNATAYILDKYMNPVPQGVPGELFLGGVNIAKGYLNNPDLTRDKFIEDIFSGTGGKLYKTGDLAKYLPDGNIEFLGRADHQVKFRGYRIEPEEISFRLNEFKTIKQSVVIIREEKPGSQRLTAYIVFNENESSEPEELTDYLREILPAYMIPSDFVILDSLPLTPNLKIDRNALPAPDQKKESSGDIVLPETPVEKILLSIWKDVLGEENIGIRDNFFNLGGDSIISIQIISRANQEGVKITPKQMFKYQTISELATVAKLINPYISFEENITGEIPMTPVQHWFFEQNLTEPDLYNHSVLLKVPNGLNEVHLSNVFSGLVNHHDGLRSTFIKNESGWNQFISENKTDNIFSVKEINVKESESFDKDILELQNSIDISKGILIKSRLYRQEDSDEDRLLIIIHHLVTDGISWRILLEDIYKGYYQLSKNIDLAFPPKSASLKIWGENLLKYAGSDKIESEKEFWLNIAEEKFKNILTDFSGDKELNTVESSETVIAELDADQTELLQKEVPDAYSTQINEILLSALIIAYSKWTNENKLIIDLEGHGREELFDNIDLSRSTGWFTSIYPVVLRTYDNKDIGETIKTLKESFRQIPDKGIGFGILKYLCNDDNIKQKLNSIPEREIIFNYLGQFNEQISQEYNWKIGKEALKLSQNKNDKRVHLLEINSLISDNRLKINFIFSSKFHKKETIDYFSKLYKESLEDIISHCVKDSTGGFTPSDFSTSGLNQQELDNLLENLN